MARTWTFTVASVTTSAAASPDPHESPRRPRGVDPVLGQQLAEARTPRQVMVPFSPRSLSPGPSGLPKTRPVACHVMLPQCASLCFLAPDATLGLLSGDPRHVPARAVERLRRLAERWTTPAGAPPRERRPRPPGPAVSLPWRPPAAFAEPEDGGRHHAAPLRHALTPACMAVRSMVSRDRAGEVWMPANERAHPHAKPRDDCPRRCPGV
jgi:hypothetical protein